MPRNESLLRSLIVLGLLSTVIYLGQFLWKVGRNLGDLILLLAMAWLVAYVLSPIARWLDDGLIPQPVVGWVRKRWGDRPAQVLTFLRIPYGLAAGLLYLLVLFVLVLTVVLVTPGIIKQLGQLANQAPRYIEKVPAWWEGIQDDIVTRFDVDRETLAKVIPVERVTQEATAALPGIIGNAIMLLQRVATGIANTLLVLVLSLYMMLDGKRLLKQLHRLVPLRYHDELRFVLTTVNRTFGGFLRGQVLMALIQGIFTGIVMRLFGLQFTMITSILSGLAMLVPELGAPVALVAPPIASILQGSHATISLLIIMFILQQILIRFIIPKIISEAIGMPPLLILVSVLVSAKLFGLWGFFFGIPLAGAIYTIGVVTLEEAARQVDAWDRRRQTPEQLAEIDGD